MPDRSCHKPWALEPVADRLIDDLSQATGLSRTVARMLAARGVANAEEARRFLNPSLEREWLDPMLISGMGEGAERVARAVCAQERIVVFGDFDLDGISAAAVATRGLAAMGADVQALIPHRFAEGYGLTVASIERVLALKPALLVTVDCGISSAQEVEMLVSHGVDVVVTDHHEPTESVPASVPVVNPKVGPDGVSRDLAGAGVALKLIQAVGAKLGYPGTWRLLADLATLGTVADSVPLLGENRALVAEGIASMSRVPRACISALAGIAGLLPVDLTSESIGYVLAPRLNAAGRMADPTDALKLLLADDPSEAERLAVALDEHNRCRQEVEGRLSAEVLELAHETYRGERAVILAGSGWHEGVKGIVASRLADVFGVPALLFSIEDGVARGSGRSVGDIDLFAALDTCCASVLTRYGGHAAAVGMALPADELPKLKACLLECLDTLPAEKLMARRMIDAQVSLGELSISLGTEIAALEPFGHGNTRPLLMVPGVFMTGRGRVGKADDHLKFTAYDGASSVPAIAFRCKDIDRLMEHEAVVDVAFELNTDEWRGRRRMQMIVREVATHTAEEAGGRSPASALVEELFAHADELLVREEYSGIEDAPRFNTKLAGVTFEGRQELISTLTPGSPLRLAREPDNPHDQHACAVHDRLGVRIGYLNRRLASTIGPAIDSGVEYDIEVDSLTGGDTGRYLGVNVLVTRRDVAIAVADEAAEMDAARAALAELSPSELEAQLIQAFLGGDARLHDAQLRALAALQDGSNTLTVMATGRGKSLIFHLYAAGLALKQGRASVFVYPLRALVADQSFHLRDAFASVGLAVRIITGETSGAERDKAFFSLASGGIDAVLTTPEFLHYHAARFAESGRVGFVVVDEAHHVGLSRVGHRPAYGRLGEALEVLGSPRVLAVTATAPDDVTDKICETLAIDEVVLDPTVRENLAIEDRRNIADKDSYVASLSASGGKCVVYVNSRERSVRLARMLRKRVPGLGFKVAFYHGGLSRLVRNSVEAAFRSGDVQVVVATSAFGEGVNIPDIRNVVLYHLPFNAVEFNQMSGRVGRDGALAYIHLLFGEDDVRINEMLLASLAPSRDDLATLWRVLTSVSAEQGEGFEITNAEIVARAKKTHSGFGLDERGISSGLGVFKDLGLIIGEGHGAYRRLTLDPGTGKVDLEASVRYAEGLDEAREFAEFKRWAFEATAVELLARLDRPILPSRQTS